jgi:hypothetical protein
MATCGRQSGTLRGKHMTKLPFGLYAVNKSRSDTDIDFFNKSVFRVM